MHLNRFKCNWQLFKINRLSYGTRAKVEHYLKDFLNIDINIDISQAEWVKNINISPNKCGTFRYGRKTGTILQICYKVRSTEIYISKKLIYEWEQSNTNILDTVSTSSGTKSISVKSWSLRLWGLLTTTRTRKGIILYVQHFIGWKAALPYSSSSACNIKWSPDTSIPLIDD